MNRGKSPKVWLVVFPEQRRENKLALLKKAIAEGAYDVKVEDLAEKILRARLFGLALTLYDRKHRKCRDN